MIFAVISVSAMLIIVVAVLTEIREQLRYIRISIDRLCEHKENGECEVCEALRKAREKP